METREDFFIHLISSENKNEFMKNKPSAFTNVLYSPNNLMDDFEVGLQNIIFEKSFDVIVIRLKTIFNIFTHRTIYLNACVCSQCNRFKVVMISHL